MTDIVRTRIPEDSFGTCRRKLPHRQLAASSRCFCLLLLVVSSIACASGFVSTDKSNSNRANGICPAPSSSHSALFAFPGFNNNNNNNGDNKEENDGWEGNDLFESFKSLFWNKDADQNSSNSSSSSSSSTNQSKSIGGKRNQAPAISQFFQPLAQSLELDEEEEDDELPAGTSLLFKIPARQLKPGGLRLFLMFYLMGMQNTPDRNTWRADQRLLSSNVSPKNLEGFDDIDSAAEAEPEEKTYVLEMLYDIDRTGMLQIELLPSNPKTHKQAEIRIYRCGSRPSTSYLMQESVIVDGVLDELQMITGEKPAGTPTIPSDSDEPEIADEDRLLITDPLNAIEAARESLAFS